MNLYEDRLADILEAVETLDGEEFYLLHQKGGRSRGPRGYWVADWRVNPEWTEIFAVAVVMEGWP